jgi:uncharacterized protein (DUF2062 family)
LTSKAVHDAGAVSGENVEPTTAGSSKGFWRRWIVEPLRTQLVQGNSPERLGWTIGAGVALGVFPWFGVRAWICLFVGWLFRLNQPTLHLFKSLCYPLHLALLLPFAQFGQRLFGEPQLAISMTMFEESLSRGFGTFLHEFGGIMLRAGVAWLLVAPAMLVVLRLVVTPLLRRMRFAGAR